MAYIWSSVCNEERPDTSLIRRWWLVNRKISPTVFGSSSLQLIVMPVTSSEVLWYVEEDQEFFESQDG